MNHNKTANGPTFNGSNEVENNFLFFQRSASPDRDSRHEVSSKAQSPQKGREEDSPQNESGKGVRRKSPN